MSQAAVHHGRARQSSGTGTCGYCRRVLWVPDPESQYSETIRFIEKPGVKDEGGRNVVKRSSDHRVAHPEVKVQVRDLVRVVGIVAPLIRGISVFRIKSYNQAQDVDEHKRPMPGAPSNGIPRESHANFRNETRRVLRVPRPAGQYSGKIRFIEKRGVTRRGGSLPG